MKIKVCDVDASLKWINFESEGKNYSILFRDNLVKGVNLVGVYVDGKKMDATPRSTYPPVSKILRDVWQIWLVRWFRQIIKRRR